MSESPAKANFSDASPQMLEGEHKRFFTFFNVILTLIGLTFIELVMIILPFHEYVLMALLAVLSLVKFGLVIWYFMHLRWDQIFLTALFMLGLILATGTVIALLCLFPPDESAANGEATTAQSAAQ